MLSHSPSEALAEGLVNNVVVDSPQADAYQTWQNSSTDDNKVYFDLYVFNLTNKEDFINGSAPILQEVGRKATWVGRLASGRSSCVPHRVLCCPVLPTSWDRTASCKPKLNSTAAGARAAISSGACLCVRARALIIAHYSGFNP